MKRTWITPTLLVLASALCALPEGGCTRRIPVAGEKPKAFGAAVVTISGDKQAASVGSRLDQPLVFQVNDAQGTLVGGALVHLTGARGMAFHPDRGLTGSDGQFSSNVTLGGMPGLYQVVAVTLSAAGKPAEIRPYEIALGYQEMLGAKVSEIHCVRCHDSESTAERVSNHDNLEPLPHAFTEGAVLNPMSDASLIAIISHGGPALNKSPEMPPYENTLTKAEIEALVAHLRAMADPPYHPEGVFYAGN